ncbi:MAG TPA: HAD-IC family P-type ATPase, partial [Treponemataceae bacterium]|nr:HAD-IC family P-type ATPase [Treponemataceae bacterium]HPL91951.1 HAD-IC family P-type ATPase [Treponemataceae bacterium]
KAGLEVIMLTGDNPATAEGIRREAGIDHVFSQMMPEDKIGVVKKLREEGKKVVMIGDGINDAPSLVEADVGIAIGAGTDIALESADIVLVRSDLRDAVTALRLSGSVIRNIKQNLFWALIYNTLGIPLAAGVFYGAFGWQLSPMFAAAAMSMSSISVVLNALRLKFFKRMG